MREIPASQEAILQEGARKHGWTEEQVELFRGLVADAYATLVPARLPAPAYERAKQNDTAVHVYVMQAPNGDVKIGISQHPQWRAKQLSAEWRGTPSIKWLSDARSRREATEIEQAAHAVLGEERLDGEWFSCSVHRAVGAVQDQLEDRA